MSGSDPGPRMLRPRRDRLARVARRPSQVEWQDEEAITLAEAAKLFFPEGPLTVASFRTAIRNGDLAATRVAGRDMTTVRAVREMLTPRLVEKRKDPAPPAPINVAKNGPFATGNGRAAQAAAKRKLQELRIAVQLRNAGGP